MQKASLVFWFVACWLGHSFTAMAQQRCGQDYIVKTSIEKISNYQSKAAENETLIASLTHKDDIGLRNVLYIPVVVHVVYYNIDEKISEAKVKSQIEVLNADFAHLIIPGTIPEEFAQSYQDVGIRFCLADKDPDGNQTTGITYNETTYSNIGLKTDAQGRKRIHHTHLGGADAWPTDRYLNIWVCRVDEYLGYATGPDNILLPEEDGVVINFANFGNIEPIDPNGRYNMGRTTTHEVGHYFGLLHLWGKNASGCGDDLVEDTPLQGNPHYGCPTYPQISCMTSNMYMNFMDYADDACMYFFTKGQGARMRAVLENFRKGLLNQNTQCSSDSVSKRSLKDRIKLKNTLVNGEITLIQSDGLNEVLHIELFDESGRLIKKYTKIAQSEFNLQYNRVIAPGMYFLRIKSAHDQTTLKLFIYE